MVGGEEQVVGRLSPPQGPGCPRAPGASRNEIQGLPGSGKIWVPGGAKNREAAPAPRSGIPACHLPAHPGKTGSLCTPRWLGA